MITAYEDNGGGLHMTDGKLVVSGFQYQEQSGGLVADITSWEDWCEDASIKHTMAEMVKTAGTDEVFGRTIATYDGKHLSINVAVMGIAGKRYAGIQV